MENAPERLTPHFTACELACRCCGEAAMDPAFLARLEALRLDYARPMVITSGFRCARYNQQVSSTGADGPHTTGRAVDVQVSGQRAYRLVQLALAHGFSGTGVRQHGRPEARFVHLDTLTAAWGPRPRLWSYP